MELPLTQTLCGSLWGAFSFHAASYKPNFDHLYIPGGLWQVVVDTVFLSDLLQSSRAKFMSHIFLRYLRRPPVSLNPIWSNSLVQHFLLCIVLFDKIISLPLSHETVYSLMTGATPSPVLSQSLGCLLNKYPKTPHPKAARIGLWESQYQAPNCSQLFLLHSSRFTWNHRMGMLESCFASALQILLLIFALCAVLKCAKLPSLLIIHWGHLCDFNIPWQCYATLLKAEDCNCRQITGTQVNELITSKSFTRGKKGKVLRFKSPP